MAWESEDPDRPGFALRAGARFETPRCCECDDGCCKCDDEGGEREDYSGSIVLRVSRRCFEAKDESGGKDERSEKETRGKTREYRDPKSGDSGDCEVCELVGRWLESEAEILACLEPGDPCCSPPCIEALAELIQASRPQRLILSVTADQLRGLEAEAAATDLPPLHSLADYCRIDACHLPLRVARDLVALLNEFPWVDLAYLELAATDPRVPAPDLSTYEALQFYLEDAPVGLGVRRLRAEAGAGVPVRGEGVRVLDLEQGWTPDANDPRRVGHQDLPPAIVFYGDNRDPADPAYRGNHGAAVLGELVAPEGNGIGVGGIVPAATPHLLSHYDAGRPGRSRGNGNVADAIVAAAAILRGLPLDREERPEATLERGDILLLEVQRSLKPTEVDHADFDAVRLASALGLVVVEAAGNGGFDLDRYRDETGRRVLARDAGEARESGAVLVGAARSSLPHDRAPFSCFGSRVDCYAWGDGVVTTGYGDLNRDPRPATAYTGRFGGTSSASPMVAGVAAVLQGLAKAGAGAPLSPREVRRVLADPRTGTPQGPSRPGRIGVMPDLRSIVRALGLAPDPVLRSFADQDPGGLEGPTSSTPDLLVRGDRIRVRIVNRGLGRVAGVRATVYATDLATLVWPDTLRLVGTTPSRSVEQGGETVVAVRRPFESAPPDPATYVAVLHGTGEPRALPPGPPFLRLRDFLDFQRENARRSVAETDVPSQTQVLDLQLLIVGAPDQPRSFGFELLQRLPAGVEVRLEVPTALSGWLLGAGLDPQRPRARQVTIEGGSRTLDLVPYRLPARPRVVLGRVRLAAAVYPCRLTLRGALPARGSVVVLRQLHGDRELGRVTWRFV